MSALAQYMEGVRLDEATEQPEKHKKKKNKNHEWVMADGRIRTCREGRLTWSA